MLCLELMLKPPRLLFYRAALGGKNEVLGKDGLHGVGRRLRRRPTRKPALKESYFWRPAFS